MSSEDQCDLVLLPLPEEDGGVAVDRDAVVEHLRSRRLCAAVVDGERIGVVGAVAVRFAVRDELVVAVDPDGAVHPGPALADVALGLAYRVGAAVHVADVVVDHLGRLLDDERVLAGVEVSPRSRVVSCWRDQDLLLARMMAAELGAHGDAHLVDGWVVVDWDDGDAVPDAPLPLPGRCHPVAHVSRAGDLRSVHLAVTPGADSLELTWVPRLARVLDVPAGSPADATLGALEVTVADDDADDWPSGLDPAVRPILREVQRGAGDGFLATAARHLWIPLVAAELAETLDPAARAGTAAGTGAQPATRVGGGSARQLAWEHVRTPAPETDAERRLRAMPRRAVVVAVVSNLVFAAVLVALASSVDFRFLPEWLLWVAAALAAFNGLSTWWFRRPRRA